MDIILENHQSPGDILMLTAAVRELKQQYPTIKIWVDSSASEFFQNNPHIENFKEAPQIFNTQSSNKQSETENIPILHVGYCDDDGGIDNPYSIHKVHEHRKHFIWGMVGYINQKLGLNVTAKTPHADLHLTQEEKKPFPDLPEKYWVVNCGVGPFFPAKQWNPDNWELLFESLPEITFVQIGGKEKDHNHKKYDFKNVVDCVGKTTLRSSLSLLYNGQGLISSVTYAMHAWAALHQGNKPFITIGGGREQWWWEAYPDGYDHHYLHSLGSFPCCTATRACWKKECDNKSKSGYPKCLELITPETIIDIVKKYV